ncbi:hypothetical protein FNT36_10970 [Hymenobacter setariae]|uniref:Uncharacterized protein n=1 Tax=Hymenobacter setariae TaxID=2594794 RepID=A0A558BZN8_9BACT|nr:hypothetical protein [Hymenobacter setariae]TVT41933.1 hypothetical protein FNT36_10970 [Hymenobacter setariae]
MLAFLRHLGSDLRRSPLYAGLLSLGLAAFLLLGMGGTRLLGDDKETADTERGGPPRTGGHGGYVNGFNHK